MYAQNQNLIKETEECEYKSDVQQAALLCIWISIKTAEKALR